MPRDQSAARWAPWANLLAAVVLAFCGVAVWAPRAYASGSIGLWVVASACVAVAVILGSAWTLALLRGRDAASAPQTSTRAPRRPDDELT